MTTRGSKSVPAPLLITSRASNERHRLAVRSIARNRIVDVGNRNDACLERDILTAVRVVPGRIELVVMCQHDRDHTAQRATDRLQNRDPFFHVLLHLLVLRLGQPRRLVEQIAADVELADVVEQRGGACVFDPIEGQVEAGRNLRRVDRDAVAVVLGVLVLRDEVAEDHQNAVIGVAQLGKLCGLVLVKRAHGVAGDDEHASPDRDVEPVRTRQGHRPPCREEHRVVPGHDAHQQHAAECRQRPLPPAIQIRSPQRGERIEAEDHPLALDHEVQEQADEEQRQEDPQLLVHLFDAA